LQTIRYPEMPDHNDGFGPNTLKLRFKNRPEWAVVHPLELRFNRDGKGAADQYHARTDGCWPNVEEGNPNWYVYWQQVAGQVGLGPLVAMEHAPQPDDNEKVGAIYLPDMLYNPNGASTITEKIVIYPKASQASTVYTESGPNSADGIQTFVTAIQHENGHAQSMRLPLPKGGWGDPTGELDFSNAWQEDTDWDRVPDSWENTAYAKTLGFEVIVEGENDWETQRAHDVNLREAWEHGWESLDEAEENKDTTYINPAGYDPETGKGQCPRNEALTVERFQDIDSRDWSYQATQ